MSILVFIEQRGGEIKKSSLESLSEGVRIGTQLGIPVNCVFIGSGIKNLAQNFGNFGVDVCYVSDSEKFEKYSSDGYGEVVINVAKKTTANIIISSASALGKDITGYIAAKLSVSLATDCIAISVENKNIIAKRPIFAGKAIASYRFNKTPVIFTLRPNVFPIKEKKNPAFKVEDVMIPESKEFLSRVMNIEIPPVKKRELTEADVIVSGGRGLKGAENFKMIEELAEVLGAAVGASRAVVDAGWRPHEDQVGQTGKTVSPKLYIASGISGAIQHLAGMSSSKYIVAINKDPEAPIFKVASYCIVGDVFEVVPALTQQLKKFLKK